jgi:hypothetical protein
VPFSNHLTGWQDDVLMLRIENLIKPKVYFLKARLCRAFKK